MFCSDPFFFALIQNELLKSEQSNPINPHQGRCSGLGQQRWVCSAKCSECIACIGAHLAWRKTQHRHRDPAVRVKNIQFLSVAIDKKAKGKPKNVWISLSTSKKHCSYRNRLTWAKCTVVWYYILFLNTPLESEIERWWTAVWETRRLWVKSRGWKMWWERLISWSKERRDVKRMEICRSRNRWTNWCFTAPRHRAVASLWKEVPFHTHKSCMTGIIGPALFIL